MFYDFVGRVPDGRLPYVHRSVLRVADRQRAGMLRGHVLDAYAISHQHVHREHGRRRPGHDAVLRAVPVCRHAPGAVLAARQLLVPDVHLRQNHCRAGELQGREI